VGAGRIVTLAAWLALVGGVQGDEPEPDPLEGLRFLTGSCWQGTFPDGASVDTHCYRSFYGGAFIRDTHVVRGPNPAYHGETIYHWDKEKRCIVYRYWNSLGGVSDGTVQVEKYKLLFPAERHVRDDGSVVEMQSVIKQVDSHRHILTAEEKVNDRWRESWSIEFSRIDAEPDRGMPRPNGQAPHSPEDVAE
jgi:hypothetical protein